MPPYMVPDSLVGDNRPVPSKVGFDRLISCRCTRVIGEAREARLAQGAANFIRDKGLFHYPNCCSLCLVVSPPPRQFLFYHQHLEEKEMARSEQR